MKKDTREDLYPWVVGATVYSDGWDEPAVIIALTDSDVIVQGGYRFKRSNGKRRGDFIWWGKEIIKLDTRADEEARAINKERTRLIHSIQRTVYRQEVTIDDLRKVLNDLHASIEDIENGSNRIRDRVKVLESHFKGIKP